jgi:hypothetical protein
MPLSIGLLLIQLVEAGQDIIWLLDLEKEEQGAFNSYRKLLDPKSAKDLEEPTGLRETRELLATQNKRWQTYFERMITEFKEHFPDATTDWRMTEGWPRDIQHFSRDGSDATTIKLALKELFEFLHEYADGLNDS